MTRTRRDHMKFLTLIKAVTLLHQHQREIKTGDEDGETFEYIEAAEADVKLAWELANHVLMRSLDDVPAQTRRLLLLIDRMVRANASGSRSSGWTTALRGPRCGGTQDGATRS